MDKDIEDELTDEDEPLEGDDASMLAEGEDGVEDENVASNEGSDVGTSSRDLAKVKGKQARQATRNHTSHCESICNLATCLIGVYSA
jgi:hypothetical protein